MVLMPEGEGPQHDGICGDDDHSEEVSAESDGGKHEGLLQELLQAESQNETESACSESSDDSLFDLEKSLGKRLKVPMQAWTTSPSRRSRFQVPLKWLQMRRKWFQLCLATPIF